MENLLGAIMWSSILISRQMSPVQKKDTLSEIAKILIKNEQV